MSEHTPGKLIVEVWDKPSSDRRDGKAISIHTETLKKSGWPTFAARVYHGTSEEAEYVANACNSHEELLAAGDSLAEVVLSLLEGKEHSDQQLDELRDSWLVARLAAKTEEGKS